MGHLGAEWSYLRLAERACGLQQVGGVMAEAQKLAKVQAGVIRLGTGRCYVTWARFGRLCKRLGSEGQSDPPGLTLEEDVGSLGTEQGGLKQHRKDLWVVPF